jgi:serine/threonine protein phosphatase PrpC
MPPAHSLKLAVGIASETGRRPANEDFAAACHGELVPVAGRGMVAVVADGVGGHKGGRVAAELSVRQFIEGYYSLPPTWGVQRVAAAVLEAVNRWVYAQGRRSAELDSMATTLTGLVFVHRTAHLVHVGDSRAYRLSEGRLERLTRDHNGGRGERAQQLHRAIGFEESVRIDHARTPLRLLDRFLLCSDGVHGALSDPDIGAILAAGGAPEQTARRLVEAALASGSTDNATATVIDVLDLPAAGEGELGDLFAGLPVREPPRTGEQVDGFRLHRQLSDGRYSRLFQASDEAGGREVVLKFPKARIADDHTHRLAFVREAWVAGRVRSPWLGEVVELPASRQTRLYSVMPFYDGETLEARLRRAPAVGSVEGLAIAGRLIKAVSALHRAGIIHRDIKPDNVVLERGGGQRLLDLGVARVPGLEEFPAADIPGTASYMAPELFQGEPGDERSDQFALAVTLYRMFTGQYPYGEIEPFSHPRFAKPVPLARHRPDLPAWLDTTLARALSADPQQRFEDVIELGHELEFAMTRQPAAPPRRRPLYQRNPLLFWQASSAVLLVLLLWSLARGG